MWIRKRRIWRRTPLLLLLACVCWRIFSPPGIAAGRNDGPVGDNVEVSDPQVAPAAGAAQELFQKAIELIDQEQFLAAIPILQQVASLAPNQARVHYYLGYAFWKDRRWSAATTEFESALKLEPGNRYTKYFLGRIAYTQGFLDRAMKLYEDVSASGGPIFDTYQRLGQVYLRMEKPAKALELIQQALLLTPLDGGLHYQLGKIYRQLGRLEEAQQEFEAAERLKRADQVLIQKLLQLSEAIGKKQNDKVLKLREELLSDPSTDSEILTWLGRLLGQGEFYAEAVEPLRQAAERNQASYKAHYNLGFTLMRLRRDREAEISLKRALELQPHSIEVNSVLGVLYVKQNRNREAIDKLRAARKAQPDNPRVLAILGQQYLQGWYLEEAIESFRDAVRLNPRDANLRYLLIDGYQRNKEYDKALMVAQECLQLFPSEARSHFEMGRQMVNLGHYQDARPYFRRVIQIDPSFTVAYNEMGDVQLRQGEYQAALESFQRAKTLDPKNLDVLKGIGQSLLRLKRYPEALAELKKAIELHPDDAECYFHLSQAHMRMGNRENAARVVATYRELHAKEMEKQDRERPRTFRPEAHVPAQ